MRFGVPQGSVLGPLLFIIYINDIIHYSEFSHTLFADDTCLFMQHKDPMQLENLVNKELEKINDWLKINQLSLNVSKSNFLLFSGNKRIEKFQLFISGIKLEETTEAKYLGVIIDNKLNWKGHLEKLYIKLNQNAGILRKVGYFLPMQNMKSLFYSFIQAHASYCITSWGSPETKGIGRINKVISKCINFINKYDKHNTINKFNPLNVNDIYKLESCKLVHNFINGLIPESLSDLFKRPSITNRMTRRTSRSVCNIHLDQADTPVMFYGPKFWNSEHCYEFSNSSLHGFATALKNKLKATM